MVSLSLSLMLLQSIWFSFFPNVQAAVFHQMKVDGEKVERLKVIALQITVLLIT